MPWQHKEPNEELSNTGPKVCEATEAEAKEEFCLLADVFKPPFGERAPAGTARLGRRVHLTAADKKEVNKASIGLPIPRTLKLFTYNCYPFILDWTISLEAFREKYSHQGFNIISKPGFNNVSIPRPSYLHSAPAIQERTSLSGTTCFLPEPHFPTADQQILAAPPDRQNRQISDNTASPVILDSRSNNTKPELLAKVYAWLDHVNVPIAAEPEFSSSVPEFVINEEVLWLLDRATRQRKSRRHQMPDTMLTERKNTSIRGSNNSRPSGSYLRPDESHTRTASNAIKDHPGTSARRPKSMPSGSQLPSCWNDEMDEFICHMEAQCEFSTKSIVRALKQRFSGLREASSPVLSPQALTIHADSLPSM